MNPYQIMAIIACCTVIFAGVVTFLAAQGVPILLAFLGVYLAAVAFMIGMQRRAQQVFDDRRRTRRPTELDYTLTARGNSATTEKNESSVDVNARDRRVTV